MSQPHALASLQVCHTWEAHTAKCYAHGAYLRLANFHGRLLHKNLGFRPQSVATDQSNTDLMQSHVCKTLQEVESHIAAPAVALKEL